MGESSLLQTAEKRARASLAGKGLLMLGVPLVCQLTLVVALFYLHDRAEAYAVRAGNNREFSSALSRFTTSAYASMFYIDDALWHHKQVEPIGVQEVKDFSKDCEELKVSLHNRVLSDRFYGAIDPEGKQSLSTQLRDWIDQLEQRKTPEMAPTPMEQDVAQRVDGMVSGVSKMVDLANLAAATAPDTDQHKKAFEQLQEQRHTVSAALKDASILALARVESNPEFWARDRERWIFYLAVGCGLNVAVVILMTLYFGLTITRPMNRMIDNSTRLAKNRELLPAMDGNDEFAYMDQFFHDLADALSDSLQKQRSMFENAQEVLCSLDERGKFITVNSASLTVMGYTPEDLEGSSLFNLLPDEAADLFAEKMREAKTGTSMPFEMRLIKRDRRLLNMMWSITWAPAEHCYACIAYDITELKNSERFKQAMMYILNQELRTPLTALQSFHEKLGMGQLGTLNESGKDLLRAVNRSTERMLKVTSDLVDLEKMEAGVLQLNLQMLPVVAIFQQSLQSSAQLASKKGVVLDLAPTELSVYADPQRLTQILVTLLNNSIKHTPAGRKVFLNATQHPSNVEITVSDQGRGIPRQMLNTIFDRFSQVQAVDQQEEDRSLGLELAMCKALVELHGGDISVTSEENLGTTFSFRIPNRQTSKANVAAVAQEEDHAWAVSSERRTLGS
jgi:PAS domain S-box-containing protein